MRFCSKRCNECEMCNTNWEILEIKPHGLTEERKTIPALKCMKYGQVSTTYVQLPESKQLDDVIYRR